jgi:predicted O-methyltransferase YrrM
MTPQMRAENAANQARKYRMYNQPEPPPLVQRALALAEEMGFPLMPEGRPLGYEGPPSACIPAVGRLLQSLAAARPGGRLGELGTGAGVGTAWLASGMQPGASLTSVEIDLERAAAARALFTYRPDVTVLTGDWRDLLKDEPPFDLLFMDVGVSNYLVPENWDELLSVVRVGGQIVFDDLWPIELWPPEWDDLVDLKREFAFQNPRVISVEVRTTPTQVALLITRVQ